MERQIYSGALVASLLLPLLLTGCPDDPPPGLEGVYGFSAVVFVQRPTAAHAGSLVAPDRGAQGGRLVILEPAAPSGKLSALIDPAGGDVHSLDVSPDGSKLVASVRTGPSDRYHLLELDLKARAQNKACLTPDLDLGPACTRLTFGPADDTRPIYLPDGRIAFSRSDPDGSMDFQGRARARVLHAVEADGSKVVRLDFGPGHALGARVVGDGLVHAVRWSERAGLSTFLPVALDPSGSAPVRFSGPPAGAEGLALQLTKDDDGQLIGSCIPALGTWLAGTICRQNGPDEGFSSIVNGIPTGSGCSPEGRLRDPTPLGGGRYLVSYAKVAEGCVTIEDGDRGLQPDFGVAVVDALGGERYPVFNTPDRDEFQVRPVRERSLLDPGVHLPARPADNCQAPGLNIQGFVGPDALAAGAVRVRALVPLLGHAAPWALELGRELVFALCSSEDQSTIDAAIRSDGSFWMRVPADSPIKIQTLDRYGAALAADPVWRGGPNCAQRRCSGCHQNQGQAPDFSSSQASAAGPILLDRSADNLTGFDFARDIQPILNRSCSTTGCHDAETAAGVYVTLSGALPGLDLHEGDSGRWSVAYQNLTFIDQLRNQNSGQILTENRPYVVPGRARESRLIQRIGVPCRFDCDNVPAWAPWAVDENRRHPEDMPGLSSGLSNEERWLLVNWVDAGAPFLGKAVTP